MPTQAEEISGHRLLRLMGLTEASDWRAAVRAVQQLPYGRPVSSGSEAVAVEQRGTCSGKHALLVKLLGLLAPELKIGVVHRVYRVDPAFARRCWGSQIAAVVPPAGLIDVHTYLRVEVPGASPITIDVTFPTKTAWDGEGSMMLACGEGKDHPAGPHPEMDKQRLVETYCDPALREPFIEALTRKAACEVGETTTA